jgi:hypothetical protein
MFVIPPKDVDWLMAKDVKMCKSARGSIMLYHGLTQKGGKLPSTISPKIHLKTNADGAVKYNLPEH